MDDEIKRRLSMTFAQAEGAEELPRQLKAKEVSPDLRAQLWAILYRDLNLSTVWNRQSYILTDDWTIFFRSWLVLRKHLMIDEIDLGAEVLKAYTKGIIKSGDYIAIFDFLQYAMREGAISGKLKDDIAATLEDTQSAYRLVGENTIAPIASQYEADTITTALKQMSDGGLIGAKSHLLSAAEHLTGGRWADSIRESIHAIESIAVKFAPGTKELGPALSEIEKRGDIHGALKSAFQKLYGFTSDSEGVRHALVFSEAAVVDEADALFMLGACAAFSTYLMSKGERHVTNE